MYKKALCPLADDKFKTFRQKTKVQMKIDYTLYIEHTESIIKSDHKAFWKFIRNKRNDSRIPTELTYKEDKLHDPQVIVNAFTTHFRSVFRTTSNTTTLFDLDITSLLPSILIISVEEEDIIHAIKKNIKQTNCWYGPSTKFLRT